VGEKHLNSLKRSSIAARASTPGGTTRPGSGGFRQYAEEKKDQRGGRWKGRRKPAGVKVPRGRANLSGSRLRQRGGAM